MRQDLEQDHRASVRQRIRDGALSVLKSLVLVGLTTIGLLILDHFFVLRHVTLVYLVPVALLQRGPDIVIHRGGEVGNYASGGRGNCRGWGVSLLLLSADLQLSRARPAASD